MNEKIIKYEDHDGQKFEIHMSYGTKTLTHEICGHVMILPERLAQSGSESGHQQALMCWAQQNLDKYPDLKWLTAIPNGGYRDKITAAKLKAEGVKRGVPDLLLLVKRGEFACLWIELKRAKSDTKRAGTANYFQDEWIIQARSQGHAALICIGWEHARNTLIDYLEWKD